MVLCMVEMMKLLDLLLYARLQYSMCSVYLQTKNDMYEEVYVVGSVYYLSNTLVNWLSFTLFRSS